MPCILARARVILDQLIFCKELLIYYATHFKLSTSSTKYLELTQVYCILSKIGHSRIVTEFYLFSKSKRIFIFFLKHIKGGIDMGMLGCQT